jgi:AcrR family transcriptional regulator
VTRQDVQVRPHHHPHLRETLLDSVETVLHRRGATGLTLRQVAREAGASPGAPIYHFGSLAGMLTAYAARGFVALGDAVEAEVAASGASHGPERLAALGRAYVAFAIADPPRWDVMFRTQLLNEGDPALEAAIARPRNLLLDAVRACADAGLIPAAEIEPTAIAAWSLTHGLASLWSSGRLTDHWGLVDAEGVARQVTDLFVAGVTGSRAAARVPPATTMREIDAAEIGA